MCTRPLLLVVVSIFLSACGNDQPAPPSSFPGDFTLIDLTYPFEGDTVYWPTAREFTLDDRTAGVTEKGYYYSANSFRAAEHGGTHIDAPIHFAEGKWTVDEIPLEHLIAPGVVIDVVDKCAQNRDYQVTREDIENWEEQNSVLANGVIVLLRTGFGSHWPDRDRYMGTSERGPEAVANLHFPGLAPDTARWLVKNRTIGAIGIDTPSIDFGQSTHFESHQILFEQNIPVFENVAHSDQLPMAGFTVIALPMKIREGTGGPLRLVAAVKPAR